MVSEKSLANLRKGNKGNRGNKSARGKTAGATWAELIATHGEMPSDLDPTKTWKQVVIAAAYRHAAAGNAAILRELMQRSEPQDIGSGGLVIRIVRDNVEIADASQSASAD